MTFKKVGHLHLLLIAAIVVTAVFTLHIPSEAANSTTVSTISARATDETSILLKMPYTGDDNSDNTYTVEFKPCVDVTYTVWVTAAPHSLSPYLTTLTGLAPNTCYDIKATYNDPDGVAGTVVQTLRITSTWDNTLLHNFNRFPSSGKWSENGGWGLPGTKYGKINCGTCHTFRAPNIKGITGNISSPNGTDEFPGQTAGLGVVFQSITVSNGLGDDAEGHSASRKVCEYCHSQTTYHRHDTTGQTKLTHNNNTDCLRCHSHAEGFYYVTGDCDSCHGNPPVVNTAGGPDGLANAPQTKSATAGAHGTHTAKSVACNNCHYNTAGAGATHRDSAVTLGFYAFEGAYQGGAYDGQTAVNTYNATSTTPATTVSKNNTKTCSNIYCHGATMMPNGGTDITPVWDTPATGACGTCHGATAANPPLLGSHFKHTAAYFDSMNWGYNYNCALCHKDPGVDTSLHVNNTSEIVFSSTDSRTVGGTYTGTDTMLDSYGTCNNVYCHSTAQSSPPGGSPTYRETPSWGTTYSMGMDCDSCHYYYDSTPQLATGSHAKHFQYGWWGLGAGSECAPCHNYYQADESYSCAECHTDGSFVPATANHANHVVEVRFGPLYGGPDLRGSYSGTAAPNDAYGQCSNIYCHSNGTGGTSNTGETRGIADNTTTDWGSGPITCSACHSSPPAYSNGTPKANSHAAHSWISCDKCHYSTTSDGNSITGYSKHVNRKYDIGNSSSTLTYGYNVAGGSCSGTFGCHGTAQWGTTMTLDFSDCISCHKSAMGSRRQIIDSNGDGTGTGGDFRKVSHHHYGATGTIANADCRVCHDTSLHPGGNIRLKNADTGEVYVYNPLDPSTAEPHCLSCHDSDGAKSSVSPFSPFSDGKTLGEGLYRAGVEIKDNWNKTYGHKQKGLTCLGNGDPGTGCHSSGHGSDYKGLLTKNMTFPVPPWAPYDYNDYKLCFDCHQNYPSVTKEVVLGYSETGNYATTQMDWYGFYWAPTPYFTASIQSKFRNRYSIPGWFPYPDYWGGVEQPYNFSIWQDPFTPGHNYHMSWTSEEMQGAWNYRGDTNQTGRANCTACHSVHGSNTQWGWVYDSMNFRHYDGIGPDKYSIMEMNLHDLINQPTNCNMSCHGKYQPTEPNWFEPSGE